MNRLHCGTEHMRRLASASTTSRGRESSLARRNCYVLQPLPQSKKQVRPIPPPYIPARPDTRTLRVTAILETSERLWSPLRGHPCCGRRLMGLVVTHLPRRLARIAHEIQRRSLCCMWLTNTKRFYAVQTPLRPGTRCWVLHPGFYHTSWVRPRLVSTTNPEASRSTLLNAARMANNIYSSKKSTATIRHSFPKRSTQGVKHNV